MTWLQLKFDATPDTAEQLADWLSEAGANAVTLQNASDQPILEPAPGTTPLWNSSHVIGLFKADAQIERVIAFIADKLGDTPPPAWQVNPLEDKDWLRAWMDTFKPMRFGQRLWVVPTQYPPSVPDAVNILLDPGLAFGTGTHPTTAMCLEWLDAHPPEQLELIDYGCGSGILAIAACKLGATKVWAVDNDPQALIATRNNAEKNHISTAIQPCSPEALPELRLPLLLANILAGPLISLAPLFAKRVAPQGKIVLSGIMTSQADELIEAYAPHFSLELFRQQEEWGCLHGQRL